MATTAAPAPATSSESSSTPYRFLELRPVANGEDPWSSTALTAAISQTTLPPGDNQAQEKAYLRQHRGWRDPRGLIAYSKDCGYKDLFAYFDAADRTSPVNVAATKTFKCYGLDGAQYGKEWDEIRGPCVVLRSEPPKTMDPRTGVWEQLDYEYRPLISVQELVDTLLYFKTRNAREVALRRDAQRMGPALISAMGSTPPPGMGPGAQQVYFGPAGVRLAGKVLGKDAQQCSTCGKPNTIVCSLKKCSRCNAAWYCDRDCQQKDFKRHKKECAQLAQQKAA